MATQQELEVAEQVESWINGNRSTVDKWIGNDANRLLLVISAFAGLHGSNKVREFLDGLRNRRGF